MKINHPVLLVGFVLITIFILAAFAPSEPIMPGYKNDTQSIEVIATPDISASQAAYAITVTAAQTNTEKIRMDAQATFEATMLP